MTSDFNHLTDIGQWEAASQIRVMNTHKHLNHVADNDQWEATSQIRVMNASRGTKMRQFMRRLIFSHWLCTKVVRFLCIIFPHGKLKYGQTSPSVDIVRLLNYHFFIIFLQQTEHFWHFQLTDIWSKVRCRTKVRCSNIPKKEFRSSCGKRGRTHWQTDTVKPIYPLKNFVLRGV